jgi:hypothetical protein
MIRKQICVENFFVAIGEQLVQGENLPAINKNIFRSLCNVDPYQTNPDDNENAKQALRP